MHTVFIFFGDEDGNTLVFIVFWQFSLQCLSYATYNLQKIGGITAGLQKYWSPKKIFT